MRPKTLILFIVAIGCGLVASIGVSQYLEKARDGGAPVETLKIYVAATEIAIGEKLDDKNTKLEAWPRDRVPEGAVTELKQLENMFPKTRFYKDEPILLVKLNDSAGARLPDSIPAGFRVVAVKVNAQASGGGLISPGDRVDVVLFLRKGTEVPETTTKTILRDVNVFAVGTQTDRETDKTGQSRDVRTISLLVKPKQAEVLKLAEELGTLSLTLRRPDELAEESTDGQTIQDLVGSDGDNANEKKKDGAGGEGMASWLNQNAQPPSPPITEPVVAPEPVVVEPPKFIMRVRTPHGDRVYRWKDLKGEPEETLPGGKPLPGNEPEEPAAAGSGPPSGPVVTPPGAPVVAPTEIKGGRRMPAILEGSAGESSDENADSAASADGAD